MHRISAARSALRAVGEPRHDRNDEESHQHRRRQHDADFPCIEPLGREPDREERRMDADQDEISGEKQPEPRGKGELTACARRESPVTAVSFGYSHCLRFGRLNDAGRTFCLDPADNRPSARLRTYEAVHAGGDGNVARALVPARICPPQPQRRHHASAHRDRADRIGAASFRTQFRRQVTSRSGLPTKHAACAPSRRCPLRISSTNCATPSGSPRTACRRSTGRAA